MVSPVIDLSHHNPDPDWGKMVEAGVIGVIHKATEGVGYVDPKMKGRREQAKEAGLCWSSYHFLRPGSMREQMDHYLATIDPAVKERVCLDHEDAGVSLGELVECVDMLQEEAFADLQVAIYSGHLIKEQLGTSRSEVLAGTSLWIAQYSNNAPTWPKATWPYWSLWQWTDREQVPGISAPVDGNLWNGSIDNLKKWFGPVVEPAPVPEPDPGLPVITMRVPAGIIVDLNGHKITVHK